MNTPCVYLVGTGPGDPSLISVRGQRCLQAADVIVYDHRVHPALLRLARPEARLEYAGKRGGKPSAKQPDISLRLVQLAREGKRVLRLKGGDPFVFGRGGEEAMSLVEAGVPFRIVPGISAGIGGLAYAGIPVTHRDCNQAVTFLTGHDAGGAVPDGVDWNAVAKGSPVIVVYMALKHIEPIAARLISGGRLPSEPVAVVSKATGTEQRVLETTLGTCAVDVVANGIEPPAIVVIGEVVRLRAALDWLGAAEGRVLVPDPLGTRRQGQTG